MDSKEKVLRAINFEKCEIPPIWRTVYFDKFKENWEKAFPDVKTDVESYYGYDTAICLGDESFFPSSAKVIEETQDTITEIDGWGALIKRSKTGYFAQTLKYPIEEYRDLDKLVFESADLEKRWDEFYRQVAAEKEKGKCIFAKIGGIYVRSHFLMREEQLLMDMLLEEEFCNELFDRLAEYFTDMALKTLEKGDLWDTGLFVFDDMASTHTTVFSPAVFEQYFLPRYSKMIQTLKAAGCKHVFFHSDGNILPVMDLLLEAGFEGFNPLEPRSGLDLVKLRKKHGNRAVYFGGICNTEILQRRDKKEIERHVKPLVELAQDGGVILGTHTVAEDIDPHIYDYMMELILKN